MLPRAPFVHYLKKKKNVGVEFSLKHFDCKKERGNVETWRSWFNVFYVNESKIFMSALVINLTFFHQILDCKATYKAPSLPCFLIATFISCAYFIKTEFSFNHVLWTKMAVGNPRGCGPKYIYIFFYGNTTQTPFTVPPLALCSAINK